VPTQNVNSSDFYSLLEDHDSVFIGFWAAWCTPCKQFTFAYDQVSQQYPNIVFAKINIEEQKELADLFEIRSIPHLMIFKKGIAIYSDAGNISDNRLRELANQTLNTDVKDLI
jgi:thioredoxin 1